MTAVITKQNALDKAFIGGNDDYPKDAEFDTIKVNKDATFTVGDKDITFSNHETRIATLETATPEYPKDATFNNITVNENANFKISADKTVTFANHETRIATLEESGGGGSDKSFTFTSGYPEIIITKNLTETNDGKTHTLTIDVDKTLYNGYVGDMIEFILPNEMAADLTTAGIAQEVKISRQANNTYTCPVIEYKNVGTDTNPSYKYVLTNLTNQSDLFIRMISSVDFPLSLFTSGNMEIQSVVKQPTLNTTNNIKCNIIDADNVLKLYRSPIPNIYDIREYGEYIDTWYAYFGFDEGTPEFDALIEGQEFRFIDSAFGFDFKYTKKGDKWVVDKGRGYKGYIRTPLIATTKRPSVSQPIQGEMYIKNDYTNRIIIYSCTGYDMNEGGNPFQYFYDNKLLTFTGLPSDRSARIYRCSLKDDYWQCIWDFDVKLDEAFDVSAVINLDGVESVISWHIISHGGGAGCEWIHKNNQIEVLKCEHVTDQVRNPKPDGLTILTPKCCVYALSSDLGYEEGTNPFEFLASKACYTITPRPEACSTLYTTFNIRTTGDVIGQNIESHVFTLNNLGNDVDRAVTRISQLTQSIQELFAYVEDQIAKLNETIELMQFGNIAGAVFNVLPSIGSLVGKALSIESAAVKATTGTFSKLAVEGEFELEDIVSAGTATLNKITAKGETTLTDLTSSGLANFKNVEIVGETEVANITSSGLANFRNVEIVGETEVANITSTGTATFKKIKSTEEADFGSVFANSGKIGNINFDEGAIELEDIVATGTAEFNDISATGTATFDTLEADDVTFADMHITGLAEFEHLSMEELDAIHLRVEQDLCTNYLQANGVNIYELMWGSAPDPLSSDNANSNVNANEVKLNGVDVSGYSGEYTNNHLMTSAAIKELIDNSVNKLTKRIEALEAQHQLESSFNKELIKQIEELEMKCANIYADDEIEDKSPNERLEILESKLKNVYVDVEVTGNETVEQRIDILKRKCSNIVI